MKKLITLCLLACFTWAVQAQDLGVKAVYVYDDVTVNPPHKVSGDSIIVNDTMSFGVNLHNTGSQILGAADSVSLRYSVNGKVVGFFGKYGFANLVPSQNTDVTLQEKYVFTQVGSARVCAKYVYSTYGVGGSTADDSLCKTFTVAPPAGVVLSSFSPSEGYRGSQVVLTGFRFDATPANNEVKLNGVAVTVDTASTTRLVITVPATATSGVISVKAGGKTSTSTNSYNVRIPKINSFSPDSAFIADTVRISCTDVINKPGVKFNGKSAALVIWMADTVWAEVPAGATNGKITFDLDVTTAISANDFIVRTPQDTSKDTTSVQSYNKIEGKVWQNGEVLSITQMTGDFNLSIVDMGGKVFINKSIKMENVSDLIEVDISALKPGVYIAILNEAYYKFVKSE